jgi:hypothetical protein
MSYRSGRGAESDWCPGWISSGRDAVVFGAETEDETTRDGGWILGGRLELTPGFGGLVSVRGRR